MDYAFPGDSGCVSTISGDPGVLFAATSKQSFDQLSQSVSINDLVGVQQMVARGTVLILPSGTKVFVLSVGSTLLIIPTTVEVRVTDGRYAGRVVWMSYEFVRK